MLRAPFIGVAALTLAGCATIIHGTTQDIHVDSTPANAQVIVDETAIGNTPIVHALARNKDHVIRVELAGYQPYEAKLTRSMSGWFLGNILIGGLIGIAVDAISGGMYNLTPAQVQAQLGTQAAFAHPGKDGVFVMVVMQPDPSWQRIGTLERK